MAMFLVLLSYQVPTAFVKEYSQYSLIHDKMKKLELNIQQLNPTINHSFYLTHDSGQLKARCQLTTRLQVAISDASSGFTETLQKVFALRFVNSVDFK